MSTGERDANVGKQSRGEKKSRRSWHWRNAGFKREHRYAALDLGTNNCRLLIAAPRGKKFRIVDSFSRIVRLGEGVSTSGLLSDAAMRRTINALRECSSKMQKRGATHVRCIATQACRGATNGKEFLERVRDEVGLDFEIISTEEEARLAVAGCADLVDASATAALVFDIGGGSTELSWVRRKKTSGTIEIASWTSLPFGVVSLAEKWGGKEVSTEVYEAIVQEVCEGLARVGDPSSLLPFFENDSAHLLGTSGTVTSIAGVHLGLSRYRRDRVDGLWLDADEARAVSEELRACGFEKRAAQPCIGKERADLVVCGCAILEALLREWPATRIRVADRGLREGILNDLADTARKERHQQRRTK